MISCEQAAHICNKTQYKEATFWERVKLKMHLVMCKTCSAFSKKNAKLTTLCERANLHVLSEAEKAKMKRQLRNTP